MGGREGCGCRGFMRGRVLLDDQQLVLLIHGCGVVGGLKRVGVEIISPSTMDQPRPHPRTLLSSALLPHLATLQSLESTLSQELHGLLSDRTVIDSAHTNIKRLLPRIVQVEAEVGSDEGRDGLDRYGYQTSSKLVGGDRKEGLLKRVGVVNEIAERVGGKVRGLDLELKRVREAAERLNEVMELKVRLDALHVVSVDCSTQVPSVQYRHL